MWSGLGLNYKSIANLDADIAYFRSIGLTKVRIHIPWPTGTEFDLWLAVAKRFYDEGFYTIFGVTAEISASYTWDTYVTEASAAALSAKGKCSEFQIGNEMDINNDDGYISDADLRSNIRSLAVDIKAIFDGPISYATSPGESGDAYGSGKWIEEGKGALDYISLNVYGFSFNPYRGVDPLSYLIYIPQFIRAFGSGCYVSEFNLDADATNFSVIPDAYKTSEIRKMYATLKNIGFNSMYFYTWCGFKNLNNDFAVQLTSGDTLNMWNALLNDNGRPTKITS